MISNRYITAIATVLIVIVTSLAILSVVYSDEISNLLGDTKTHMQYEEKIFDTDKVLDINIKIDQEDWQSLLDDATQELYYTCDVEINGDSFYEVGVRAKGNTSLSSIASDPDNDRYSLKLEFDQYVDGQTLYGLDKLVLNNGYADASLMKEAIVYDMFAYLGADAPLYNYAKLSVNGEYFGVYLALEAIEDSFMLRNFGTQRGNLYKPDGMNMGEGKNNNNRDENNPPSQDQNQNRTADDMQNFGGGRGGMSSGGANLNYTDDSLDSYSTIWSGEVTSTYEEDHIRVVTALKNISLGTDLEKYLDVDNAIKYMVAHSFAVNEDSLSGSMAHNYYLYEENGQLNILPWDYNLAFGTMSGGNATSAVNDPIDTPFSSTQFFNALLENEEYLKIYHEYYNKLIEEYFKGGKFEETYNRIKTQIDTLVKDDPTAMYTYEEYLVATDVLFETVMLRAESVSGQLNGSIPSTESGQRQDSSSLIDASHINLSDMGTMNGGNRGRNFDADRSEVRENAETPEPPERSDGFIPEDFGGFFENNENGRESTERFPGGQRPGFRENTGENTPQMPEKMPEDNQTTEDITPPQMQNRNDTNNTNFGGRGGMQRQDFDENGTSASNASQTGEAVLIISLIALLIIAIIFAKFYRKKL